MLSGHRLAMGKLKPHQKKDLASPIATALAWGDKVTECNEAFHDEATPGTRFKDIYSDRCVKTLLKVPVGKEQVSARITEIHDLFTSAAASEEEVVVVCDGAVPKTPHQAVAACEVWRGGS